MALTKVTYSMISGSPANVLDFGAVGDGVTDDTNAIQAALDSGNKVVRIPEGTYRTGAISVPSGVQVYGANNATIISPISSFSGLTFWSVDSAASDVVISDLTFNVNISFFATTTAIYADAADNLQLNNLRFTAGGESAIATNNCTNSTISGVKIDSVVLFGIVHRGANSANIKTVDCVVTGLPATGNHGIQNYQGFGHTISGCKVYSLLATAGFGINFDSVANGTIKDNVVYDTVYEGINITASNSCSVTNNKVFWTASSSIDFGISIDGAPNFSNFNVIEGNVISRSYKSGIALAGDLNSGCAYNLVCNNTMFSTGLGGTSADSGQSSCGVVLYGTGTSGNQVLNNAIYGDATNTQYGVLESSALGGTPNGNIIGNNTIEQVVVSKVTTTGAVSRQYFNSAIALNWTPTVTSGSGSIGTLGTVTAKYSLLDNIVMYSVEINITTNGSAGTDIRFTLPVNASITAVGTGREGGVSGKDLTCDISGSTAIVRNYDNTYPGATGAVLRVTGTYFIA